MPPDHFWDFMEDGDFDKFAAREKLINFLGRAWHANWRQPNRRPNFL